MILPDFPINNSFAAEIYKWGHDSVLKLYRSWMNPDAPELEAAAINVADQAGIRVPQVKGISEVNGRHGIIRERIEGYSFRACLHSYPHKLVNYARQFAELHISIHVIASPFLRSQKKYISDILSNNNSLPKDLLPDLLCSLDRLPSSDRLCQGDFYDDNIIISSSGPVIIDWEKSTCGNPAADLAYTSLYFSKTIKNIPVSHSLFKIELLLFHYIYSNRYRRIAPAPITQMHLWIAIIAALKRRDNLPDQNKYLLKIIRKFDYGK